LFFFLSFDLITLKCPQSKIGDIIPGIIFRIKIEIWLISTNSQVRKTGYLFYHQEGTFN
jgi:hypothetical protein